jgi:hypothetical protein
MKMRLYLKNSENSTVDGPPEFDYRGPMSKSETRIKSKAKTTAILMSLNTFRIAGLFIWVTYGLSLGVLPPIFAYSAGIGDFLIGISAIPMAYVLIKGFRLSRELAIVWNALGLLDFALAYALGTSFNAGTTVLTFPWIIITAGLVPMFMTIHAIILYRLMKNNINQAVKSRL